MFRHCSFLRWPKARRHPFGVTNSEYHSNNAATPYARSSKGASKKVAPAQTAVLMNERTAGIFSRPRRRRGYFRKRHLTKSIRA